MRVPQRCSSRWASPVQATLRTARSQCGMSCATTVAHGRSPHRHGSSARFWQSSVRWAPAPSRPASHGSQQFCACGVVLGCLSCMHVVRSYLSRWTSLVAHCRGQGGLGAHYGICHVPTGFTLCPEGKCGHAALRRSALVVAALDGG